MFNDVPYTEYIDIWLQRLIIGCGASHKQSPLSLMAKCVDRTNEARSIWNNEWITSDGHNEARKVMQDTDIISPKLIDEIKPEIDIENFRPWGYDH